MQVLQIINTSMKFANVHFIHVGFALYGGSSIAVGLNTIQMDNCQFIRNSGVPSVVYLSSPDKHLKLHIF